MSYEVATSEDGYDGPPGGALPSEQVRAGEQHHRPEAISPGSQNYTIHGRDGGFANEPDEAENNNEELQRESASLGTNINSNNNVNETGNLEPKTD